MRFDYVLSPQACVLVPVSGWWLCWGKLWKSEDEEALWKEEEDAGGVGVPLMFTSGPTCLLSVQEDLSPPHVPTTCYFAEVPGSEETWVKPVSQSRRSPLCS